MVVNAAVTMVGSRLRALPFWTFIARYLPMAENAGESHSSQKMSAFHCISSSATAISRSNSGE